MKTHSSCGVHVKEKKCYTETEAKFLVVTGKRKSYYKCSSCGQYHTSSLTKSGNSKATCEANYKQKRNRRFKVVNVGGDRSKKPKTLKPYKKAKYNNYFMED